MVTAMVDEKEKKDLEEVLSHEEHDTSDTSYESFAESFNNTNEH
jgi:hypothetical protein